MKIQDLIDRARKASLEGGPHFSLLRELSDALAKVRAMNEIRRRDATIAVGDYLVGLPKNATEAVIHARAEGRAQALLELGIRDDFRVGDVWRNDDPSYSRPGRTMIVVEVDRGTPILGLEPLRPEDAVGFRHNATALTRIGWARIEKAGSDE